MAGLYFYVPKSKIKDIVDCGLKLSEWCDREISLPGFTGNRRVIKALLNPRDDIMLQKDTAYQCLRLDIDLDYCRVGDAALYKMGTKEPKLMERYIENLVPLSDYRFGTFRDPEVLVMTSVLHDRIEITGRDLDVPILYESSAVLYLNNLLEKHEEVYKDSGNHLLYAFFIFLESQGQVVRFEDKEHKYAVFFHADSKEYTVLQIP
jgi:hypothetical protein